MSPAAAWTAVCRVTKIARFDQRRRPVAEVPFAFGLEGASVRMMADSRRSAVGLHGTNAAWTRQPLCVAGVAATDSQVISTKNSRSIHGHTNLLA
jgi:hypothetical protein